MTDIMTLNYLFLLGIVIPCVITIALFVVFLLCWRKYQVRRDIMTKKHDPHKRTASEVGSDTYSTYKVPRPPLPPKWIYKRTGSPENPILPQHNEAFDVSPDSATAHNRHMYNTFHDSGMSDLSEIHYKFERQRPHSQASTDSEDSGFRSSRSGQYLHSAQNSNAQELPLFKPLSSNKDAQTVNLSPTDLNKVPSRHHSRRKHKSPKISQRTSRNDLITDISESPLDTKVPVTALSVISPQIPQMTLTTATVHRPSHDDYGSAMAYSVV